MERKYFSIVAVILQGAAICIASFAMVSLYRLTYIITGVFVVVALHQALSPRREEKEENAEEEEEEEDEEAKTEAMFDDSNENLESQVPSAVEMSDSEYEYEYKVNLVKRKVKPGSGDASDTSKDTGRMIEEI